MEDVLRVSHTGAVARVEICRPALANAIDPQHFHALADLLGRLDGAPEVRAIVLTGSGDRAFCAGLNLRATAAIAEEFASSGPTGLGAVLRRARRSGTPLIGRINGACVAGGLGLLAACDLAIARHGAVFALPEIAAGFYPYVVLAGLEGRVAPIALASLAASGRRIDAEEAMRIGLVSEVVTAQDLDAAVDRLVAAILRLPPGAAAALGYAHRHSGAEEFDRRMAEAERLTRRFRIMSRNR